QIVGITAKIANDFTENTILNCLKKRNACLVKGKGMLVTGRSSKEALTTAVLLEKACRTEILGERIGGVKKVPLIAAIIMHYVYQKKYSVIDLTEQEKEEGYV
ncbi:MAG: class II aldolase/adducin family protein, partial [Oscillospiraceae bacterium]